jgi:glycosyltransferase involved in cell wall biosynthesis
MIDIVIPTKNSGKTLDFCLKSIIQNISYGKIIIVDNYSQDDTKEIALKYNCIFLSSSARYTLALREGAMKTNGDYFMIIDSDVIINRDIRRLFKYINKYAVIKGVTKHWFKPKFDNLAKYHIERMIKNITGLEATIVRKKEFLKYTKQWEENVMDAGGDLNLFYIYKKNKVPMMNLPLTVSTHITGDWKRFWRQQIWYARSYGKKRFLPIRETNRDPLKSLFRAIDGGLRYKDLKLFVYILGNAICALIGRLTKFEKR